MSDTTTNDDGTTSPPAEHACTECGFTAEEHTKTQGCGLTPAEVRAQASD